MNKPKETKIGIIGCGNMGRAIAQRIKSAFKIVIFDKDETKTKNISRVVTAPDLIELVNMADVVVLAVKPQDFNEVLGEIKNNIDNKLVISIAAGIPTKFIEKNLGRVRVIRVMPNLPAKIGRGMSCLCKGKFATTADLKFVEKIFGFLGGILFLDENMMDEATAVSGSGPGFWGAAAPENESKAELKKYTYNVFMPKLSVAAEREGFTKKQANILAKSVAEGSLATVESLEITPAQLKKQVASKGGTTEAGLKELKGNIKFLPKAVRAALKRAKELSNEAATRHLFTKRKLRCK